MKRWPTLLMAILLAIGLSACASEKAMKQSGAAAGALQGTSEPAADEEEKIEIPEKLFAEQINHMYFYPEDYLGKTIVYEGIFDTYTLEATQEEIPYVFRYGPGCCANDANVGFEVSWDQDYPAPNAWVYIEGVLTQTNHGGISNLMLELNVMEVKETRGQENVA